MNKFPWIGEIAYAQDSNTQAWCIMLDLETEDEDEAMERGKEFMEWLYEEIRVRTH